MCIRDRFKIYDVEDGKIISSEVVDAGGSGHGALASVLNALKADALICGGIGGGAQMALSDVGIRLYGGVSGNADAAAEALAAGELDFNPNIRCDHHDHHTQHLSLKSLRRISRPISAENDAGSFAVNTYTRTR